MEAAKEVIRRRQKHIHIYERTPTNKGGHVLVWRCTDPMCYHYMPPHMEGILIGRASKCNDCFDDIVLSEENMKSGRPLCDTCLSKLGKRVELVDRDGLFELLDSKKSISDRMRGE